MFLCWAHDGTAGAGGKMIQKPIKWGLAPPPRIQSKKSGIKALSRGIELCDVAEITLHLAISPQRGWALKQTKPSPHLLRKIETCLMQIYHAATS
jgi:hypothetical protein